MKTTRGILDGGASGFYSHGSHTEEVESYSVSDLLDRFGLREIDFLKMDYKGCEKYLVSEDIARVSRYLHVEFSPNSSKSEIHDLITKVKGAGFRVVVLNHNGGAGLGAGRNLGTLYAVRTGAATEAGREIQGSKPVKDQLRNPLFGSVMGEEEFPPVPCNLSPFI